jgi:hypothetical protein
MCGRIGCFGERKTPCFWSVFGSAVWLARLGRLVHFMVPHKRIDDGWLLTTAAGASGRRRGGTEQCYI